MNELKLNETPLRTSRNFLVNNIKLNNVELPEKTKKFENIYIQSNSVIDGKVDELPLTYGNGKIIEENIKSACNSSIRVCVNEKDDIRIKYVFDDNNLNLVNNIEIDSNSDCNVIIEYKSKTSKECFHNGILRVNANPNINVNIVIINLLNEKSLNLESIQNNMDDSSDVNYTIIDIGAKTSVSNYYSNMFGNGCKNDLQTIYLGTEQQIKDINYIAELRGEKTDINIDVQGALKNKSKKNFKGTIDFKKGCKKAVGNENEYCMLLTDDSHSIALPMLLCTEDDVEGNHSTASGKVDGEQLFYIMSRGIDYTDAVKLIVKARFNEIIERIKDEDLKSEILQEIDRRLD